MKCPEAADIVDTMEGHKTCQGDVVFKVVTTYDLDHTEGVGLITKPGSSAAHVYCTRGHSFSHPDDHVGRTDALQNLYRRIRAAQQREQEGNQPDE